MVEWNAAQIQAIKITFRLYQQSHLEIELMGLKKKQIKNYKNQNQTLKIQKYTDQNHKPNYNLYLEFRLTGLGFRWNASRTEHFQFHSTKRRKKETAAIISIKFKTKLASQTVIDMYQQNSPMRDVSRIIYLRVKHKTRERGRDIPASANT